MNFRSIIAAISFVLLTVVWVALNLDLQTTKGQRDTALQQLVESKQAHAEALRHIQEQKDRAELAEQALAQERAAHEKTLERERRLAAVYLERWYGTTHCPGVIAATDTKLLQEFSDRAWPSAVMSGFLSKDGWWYHGSISRTDTGRLRIRYGEIEDTVGQYVFPGGEVVLTINCEQEILGK